MMKQLIKGVGVSPLVTVPDPVLIPPSTESRKVAPALPVPSSVAWSGVEEFGGGLVVTETVACSKVETLGSKVKGTEHDAPGAMVVLQIEIRLL